MKYMQISILREKKNEELSTGYVKDHAFYNMVWFKNPAFRRSDSEKNRKDFVKKQLSEIDISEKKFGRIFDEEERVIVNVQGRHGVDNAIFDEVIELPENLIDSNKNNDGGNKKW